MLERPAPVCSAPVSESPEQGGGGPAPAVVVRGLRVERGGREVLHGLDLDVAAGRVTGLLGPSGCGKSTLMRSIVGAQRVAGGTVAVLGRPAGSASLRRSVGYQTQQPAVYADLSVRENLRYFARVLGLGRGEAEAVVERVGLVGAEDSLVRSLSGGQRARVSLAVALLGEPPLLVLDEPTVGLYPLLRRDLWETFTRLARSGSTLLVSSHVMDEAERCDELLLMREGALLAGGTPQELCRRTGAAGVGEAFLALIERGRR
jgi:ABC-2 type transport system ATP-binding protein